MGSVRNSFYCMRRVKRPLFSYEGQAIFSFWRRIKPISPVIYWAEKMINVSFFGPLYTNNTEPQEGEKERKDKCVQPISSPTSRSKEVYFDERTKYAPVFGTIRDPKNENGKKDGSFSRDPVFEICVIFNLKTMQIISIV